MSFKLLTALSGAFLFSATVSAQTTAPEWGQCGGIGWTGPTVCTSGWVCTETNEYYSQCLQGTGTPSTSVPVTSPSNPATGPSSTSSAPAGSTPTLIPGDSFIRAVEDPNFHQYLRSQVKGTTGPAVLGDPVDAALFQINDGQLQQVVDSGFLYAHVEPPANSSAVKLAVSWDTTPDTLGTFVWGGDTVEWSSTTVTRPQNNAWLVCPDADGNKLLFVNLGPYDYDTPAGCADETIHAYTGLSLFIKMHSALKIETLLRQVVHGIWDPSTDPLPPDPESRRSLYAVARTCRAFYLLAMENLWHTLGDLTPILYCLPENIWCKNVSGQLQGPHRDPTEEDWQRVLIMTGHVRRVYIQAGHYCYESGQELRRETLEFLSAHRPMSTQLFPRLKSLVWIGELRPVSTLCLKSFMGPQLRVTRIAFSDNASIATYIYALSEMAPSLNECTLRSLYEVKSLETCTALQSSIPLFKNLNYLSCGPISLSDAAFRCIGQLSSLRCLQCTLERFEDNPDDLQDEMDHLFPSLEELHLVVTQPSLWFVTFLERCRMPKLKEADLWPKGFSGQSEVMALVAGALNRFQRPLELICMDLLDKTETLDADHIPIPPSLSPNDITPLLSCNSLRCLTLRTKWSCVLNDTLLEDMGRALPNLERLQLAVDENNSASNVS
ncbi:hypothetical protein EIP86_011477 [Pleurotus ostreatoroseus]|nr:hypothetical protein EIP86_011477 [Pleurotus ostreatoroseus]